MLVDVERPRFRCGFDQATPPRMEHVGDPTTEPDVRSGDDWPCARLAVAAHAGRDGGSRRRDGREKGDQRFLFPSPYLDPPELEFVGVEERTAAWHAAHVMAQ